MKAARPTRPPPAQPEFFSPDVARARRFYLDLNPGRQEPLTVVCGGLEHCTAAYAIHRESFPFYSIEYVVRGRGELTLKTGTHALEPGRVFSYGPGIPHQIRGQRTDPLVKYFVDFAGHEAEALLRSCGLAGGKVSQVHPPAALEGLFDELVESGLRARRERNQLCLQLLECIVLKARATRIPVEKSETLAFTTYQQCRQHLDRHFQRLRTLDQLARECHLNQAYLCRLFRRYDQQSPYKLLLHLKMDLAAQLLEQEGCMVKQVAAQVGFTDQFHFSRVFKSSFGISPDAFRRMR